MFDYRGWIDRCAAFYAAFPRLPGKTYVASQRIDPPMTNSEVAALDLRLRLGLPQPIRDFLAYGAGGIVCEYSWSPPGHYEGLMESIFDHPYASFYGGPLVCNLETNERDCAARKEWDKSTDLDYWVNTSPFAALRNGDYVGLYVGENRRIKNAVIYLSHDDEGTGELLAPSFDEFLVIWESIKYVGPERFYCFLDANTSRVRLEKLALLDRLFAEGFSEVKGEPGP